MWSEIRSPGCMRIHPAFHGRKGCWDAEVVALAIRQGLGIVEVGIQWSHDPLTRVSVWDGVSMAWAVPRIARRLASHKRPSRKTMRPGTSSPHRSADAGSTEPRSDVARPDTHR